jgi:hypothetical protein
LPRFEFGSPHQNSQEIIAPGQRWKIQIVRWEIKISIYDQQYYFIRPADDDSLPDLTPDTNTENRSFRFERQPFSSPPLVFFNGAKEYQEKNKIPRLETLPDILFEGGNLVVRSNIRKSLLSYDIPHLHMHPAIYIHDDGKWYEDYWYMTFTEEFDCWDRGNSRHEDDPMEIGGFKLYTVYNYSLSQDILDKTKMENRLLFKMGGSLDAFIVCEKKFSNLFPNGEKSGLQLLLVSDY